VTPCFSVRLSAGGVHQNSAHGFRGGREKVAAVFQRAASAGRRAADTPRARGRSRLGCCGDLLASRTAPIFRSSSYTNGSNCPARGRRLGEVGQDLGDFVFHRRSLEGISARAKACARHLLAGLGMAALSFALNRLSVQIHSLPRRLPLSLPPRVGHKSRFPWHALVIEQPQANCPGRGIAPDPPVRPVHRGSPRPSPTLSRIPQPPSTPGKPPCRSHLLRLFEFDFFEPLPIQIEVSEAPLTSDAGLLPLRQFDERIGLTKQFASGTRTQRYRNVSVSRSSSQVSSESGSWAVRFRGQRSGGSFLGRWPPPSPRNRETGPGTGLRYRRTTANSRLRCVRLVPEANCFVRPMRSSELPRGNRPGVGR